MISMVYLITVAILLYVLSGIAFEEANETNISRPILTRHRRDYACIFK